ncbi:2-succinyl-6-hydroxy-2,4-cyclohexadiene-1-carboxylate synthase [Myxacorys almedinensis]|uniref:2-succinyl-6-hydroxy-2, 4-cyclohexadiene-1-carboxylate synthase n=1 Tax=Myxacorys almedinensis TaxID=2651157 RepID=UPI0030829B0D
MSDLLHYTLDGDRTLPIVVFLHGFLGSSEEFDPVVSLLAGRFCCLRIDLPGHGKTQVAGGEECYAIAPTARAIIRLLDHLAMPPTYLMGYSMGGRLALYLALHYDARFPKVMLESASPGLKTEAERVARRHHDFALAQRLETDFAGFLAEWYEQPLFRSLKQHPQFETMIQNRLKNDPATLATSLRCMGTGMQPSLWQQLSRHQSPVLGVVGACDRKFITIYQEMAMLCSTLHVAISPDTGHNVHLENPEFMASCIQSFFCDRDPLICS